MDTLPFHPNLFLIFEVLGILAFLAILTRKIYQKNWHGVLEIFSALIFGMLLEIGNIYVAHSYSYSQNFIFSLYGVPLGIGLFWAVIIYCAMLLSDQYNFPWYKRPFLDALTALIFDLYADVVSVHLGFWTWIIPKDQEWYGIPFDNLAGWIFVVLSFSFVIRFIRTLNLKRTLSKALLILSPFLSYFILIVLLTLFGLFTVGPHALNSIGNLGNFSSKPSLEVLYNPQVQLWKIIILSIVVAQMVHVVTNAMLKYKKQYVWRFDLLSFLIFTGMHLFVLITMFTSGLYQEVPIFIFIGFGLFTVHLLLHFLPHMLQDKKILYIFRDTEKFVHKEELVLEKIIDEKLR